MNINSTGLEEIIKGLDKISDHISDTAARGVYDAAGAIADEVKAGLQGLPIQQDENGDPPYMPKGHRLYGVTATQKEDLLNSLGIARFRDENGVINTSIGFSGNGRTKTKRYPNGVPNRLLMRGVESGASFRNKTPVVRPAVNRVKKRAVELAKQKITDEIRKEI